MQCDAVTERTNVRVYPSDRCARRAVGVRPGRPLGARISGRTGYSRVDSDVLLSSPGARGFCRVFVTIKPSAFSSCVEMSPTTEGLSALTPEQLLCASLTTLRAAASRASSADDPDRWAAAQLALGAVL